ncbi:PASTA domain-containing protein [Paenibacillus sp. CC-CFT747]|nr:PASTA domain-containing protein [Paenibacillus sp. CC-CFT747]
MPLRRRPRDFPPQKVARRPLGLDCSRLSYLAAASFRQAGQTDGRASGSELQPRPNRFRRKCRRVQGGPSTKPSPSLSPTPSPSAEGAKAESGIVPALVGLTKEDAEKQAVAAGLHYNFFLENDSLPAGAVFKQDPPAGTPAAKGDNVTFWVSKGP